MSLPVISWNIEGLSKNYLTLSDLVRKFSAQLIFLSEPQAYRCDLAPLLTPFLGSYEAHLNSEDAHDFDLPLTHPRAKGGTMILWHTTLSPYLKVLPTPSPSFVSVLLVLPGHLPSLHTAVYLPTAGRDGDWLACLVELEDHVLSYIEQYDGHLATFLRGDFNASSKNTTRSAFLSAMISRLELAKVRIDHLTYHHFCGGGASDSDLDLLLYGGEGATESLVEYQCKLQHPLIFSHHDLIISTCVIPPLQHETKYDLSKNIKAPRILNDRFSTKWSDDGVAAYSSVVTPLLPQIRESWGSEPSNANISLLLSSTYTALCLGAKATNKVFMMSTEHKYQPTSNPSAAAAATSSMMDLQNLRIIEASPSSTEAEVKEAKLKLQNSRILFKKEVRAGLAEERDASDSFLHNILSNPKVVFRKLRSSAKSAKPAVKKMRVGDKVYSGEAVADGMFDSLNNLKAPNMDEYRNLPPYTEAVSTYNHIIKLASTGKKIPPISCSKGEELLHSLRSSVMDYFSVTSLHFLHLGVEGVKHFVFIFNAIIDQINSSSTSELNTVWANILFKGGDKDREHDRSYRTISCCPIVAKALDSYMVELYDGGWSAVQAQTQFQGSNSSHELAALCVTEAIIQGLHTNKEPVYLLLLDAQSAFDRVVIEHAIRCAYVAGTQDEGLLYLDNRLRNRLTYIEWDKQILGPILDTIGVEQGGIASDRVYRLVNNEQLETAQQSKLGVSLGVVVTPTGGLDKLVLSGVGQADDVGLLANSLKKLKLLLYLTVLYCDRYQVKLVGAKTKLLVFNSKQTKLQSSIELASTTISVDGEDIHPSTQASHVGVVRSVDGNGANIAARLLSHRKAVYGLLSAGLAKGHRANPAASLRVEAVYGVPVLLSGLASLVLSAKEENMLGQHYKVHLERLLRLHQATPAPVVFMLAGCLPLPAQIHLRMFSLFGQLCRLRDGNNILAIRARDIFSSALVSSKSWFWKIRQLCLQYGVPHPLEWLSSRPSKLQVKSVSKSAVHQYWLHQLRCKSDSLPSLQYLKNRYLGLSMPHPIYRTCGSSPWEVEKGTTQARLLSGRSRLEALTCHWVPWNREGLCTLPLCWGTEDSHKGTLENFILSCPSLFSTRQALYLFNTRYLEANPILEPLVNICLEIDPIQFWIDCSTMSPVISAVQLEGESLLSGLFKLTRNFCHGLYKARMCLLESD